LWLAFIFPILAVVAVALCRASAIHAQHRSFIIIAADFWIKRANKRKKKATVKTSFLRVSRIGTCLNNYV
jgi:hypothetical protein